MSRQPRFTVLLALEPQQRIAIAERGSNVVALLSPADTHRFQDMFEMLAELRKCGLDVFFERQQEKLCQAFAAREAA